MNISLDSESPVPLYHQIAEALGYRIATGRLSVGERLPAVREAAVDWGVHMHTVRRAYGELARQGLLETRGAKGTCVVGVGLRGPEAAASGALEAFIERVVREAQERHGVTRHDLSHLLANWSPPAAQAVGVVHVVECSEAQCADHADQIRAQWEVDALPWCLSKRGEPSAGPIIATYFHHNDVRQRWPHRLREIHFAAIHPDPDLLKKVPPPPHRGRRVLLKLCELDETMAQNIASDLSLLIARSQYRVQSHVVRRPGELLSSPRSRARVLFSPRTWGKLTADERKDPRAVRVRYVFTDEEMESLGRRFGWRRRAGRRGR